MTNETITRLSVYEDSAQIVQWGGRIVADRKFWCVDYTVSVPGFVNRDFCPTFIDEDSAWRHVEKLGRRCCIPVDVLDGAGTEEGQ